MKIKITDGNATETASSLPQAISIASSWYDYMELGATAPKLDTEGVESVKSLNKAIDAWQNEIAKSAGRKEFSGHGNYNVSAADEMGLQLRVEEGDAEDELDAQFERAVESGKLDFIEKELEQEIAAGTVKPMDDLMEE